MEVPDVGEDALRGVQQKTHERALVLDGSDAPTKWQAGLAQASLVPGCLVLTGVAPAEGLRSRSGQQSCGEEGRGLKGGNSHEGSGGQSGGTLQLRKLTVWAARGGNGRLKPPTRGGWVPTGWMT